MPTEETIRAFLLGTADPEAEKAIEEGILDGSVAGDDLFVIEEELIDDHVFGRLSPDEERSFDVNFLVNQERRDRLGFSRAIRKYALERPSGARKQKRPWLGRFPRLVLAASLSVSGLAIVSVAWLGIRDARLSRELALVSRTSDERQRLLNSMEEQQMQRMTAPEATVAQLPPATPSATAPTPNPPAEPAIQLRPGVRRGIEAVPVLHVATQTGAVRITLALAFKPQAGLREELARAGGERIWSQEVPSAAATTALGATTLYVPAQLLSPGDYQLRVKDLSGDPSDEGDVYAFRVSRQ